MEEKKKAILQETDLLELVSNLWNSRKLFVRNIGIAAVIGLIVAFSIPKVYTSKVVLAPEVSGESNIGGSLSSLASMAGINIGTSNGSDALYPELYPQIVSSAPFIAELFKVQVKSQDGELCTTYYDYLYNHQKLPWWKHIIVTCRKVVKAVASLFSSQKPTAGGDVVDPFNFTRNQRNVANSVKDAVSVFVDKKDQLITLSVTAQDPLISATMTDSVKVKLQDAIIAYRTKKACRDLEFSEKMYADAQKEYFDAQKRYAIHSDKNQSVVLDSYLIETERLRNEMDLAYSVYNQMAQQLQVSKIKVQERTPVFTEVEPVTVPLLGSGMSRALILFIWIFLGLVCTAAWILCKPVVISWCSKIQNYEHQNKE